jgi:uncharacterized protein (TIGR03435 family)
MPRAARTDRNLPVLAWRCLAPAVAATIGIAIAASMIPRWTAYAQSLPAFQVSPSIANNRLSISRTPQRIAFQSALLPNIMAFAYELPVDRIERRPQWMYEDKYDVAVSTTAPVPLPRQKLMLRKLFEERFGLVVHRASYQSPVYFLVPGPQVNLTAAKEAGATGLPEFRLGGRICEATQVSMNDLADWLYPRLQLPVLDKTGIPGLFDIEIRGLPIRGGAEGIIQAVRDSLGLNLELHPGTAESLIIDRVHRPDPN